MKNAFNYMFRDTDFLKKTYVFFLFILFSVTVSNYANLLQPNSITGTNWYYVALSFITAIVMFIPQGYILSLIKSAVHQEEICFLPNVDIKRNFIQGLKISVAFGLLYFLIIALLSVLLTVSLVAGLTTGDKTYFYITIAVILFVLFILFCYFPVFTWMFAFKDNFLTYFRYILATKIFCLDFKRYVLYFTVITVIMVTSAFITGKLSNPVYLKNPLAFAAITIVDSLIMYYVMLVLAYLIAKSIKPTEAFELLGVFQYEKTEETETSEPETNSDETETEN
ncbi:DUF4013 domain-containing protein [bacterium]|nr:DUF4013 domain-containing protein [bacterium]